MFDAVGTFTRQFTPVEGGFLFYPSRKSVGKLVTPAEYAELVAQWRRVAGPWGIAKAVRAIVSAIILVLALKAWLAWPDWANDIAPVAIMMLFFAYIFWASLAPFRLVKERPAILPPRAPAAATRAARAAIGWPMVVFGLVFSSILLLKGIDVPVRSAGDWVKLIGGGVGLAAAYLWIAFAKVRDVQSDLSTD